MNSPCLTIKDIIDSTKGELITSIPFDKNLHGNASIYAEQISNGDIYIAINSKKYDSSDGCLGFTNNEDSVFGFGGTKDGHDDINLAIQNGAVTIIVDNKEKISDYKDINIILVNDSLNALCELSKCFLYKCNVKTIAITGSVGKTSTANCLYDFLSKKYKVLKSEYIRSTVLGITMDVLSKISSCCDYYIIELQSDSTGQIDKLCKSIKIDYAIITEIAYSHLAKFKNIENILTEKTITYNYLESSGKIFINGNNSELYKWYNKNKIDNRIVTVGNINSFDYYLDYDNQFYIKSLVKKGGKTIGQFIANKEIHIMTQLLCISFFEFVSKNEITINEINNITRSIHPILLRYNSFLGKNNCKVVLDSYNASYLSMQHGINKVCKNSQHNEIILILGSMLELDNKAEEFHRAIAKEIQKHKNITNVFLLGESMLYTYFELKKTLVHAKIVHSFNYETIIEELLKVSLNKNTVVYIKGSGSMRMELFAPYVLAIME